MLEVNQDPLCQQAKQIKVDLTHEIWAKDMADGSKAVGLFNRDFLFEGNIVYFLMPNLIVGAEYRQKSDKLRHVSNILEGEDDWWSIAASYLINDHWSVTGAYANLGSVLNHDEPISAWLQVKYEL